MRLPAVACFVVLLVGCREKESAPKSDVTTLASSAPAAIVSAPAQVESAAAPIPPKPTGPCDGKNAGEMACDGFSVIKCKSAGESPEIVRKCLDIETCSNGECVGACPEGEIYVPPTDPKGFTMGKGTEPYAFGSRASGNGGKGVADAPHKVVLTKPFCMDQTEVTAGAYETCVKEKGCKVPVKPDRWATYGTKPDHPINMVDWFMATYYCQQVGKSLPSEAQWEWAATGGDGRTWPWGEEEPTCEHADFTKTILVSPGGDSGCHGGGPSKVGTHRKGDKLWPQGPIFDLAGNVWEWVIDSYVPYNYGTAAEVDPVHENKGAGNRVVRGGGWNRSGRGIQSAFRGGAVMTYKVPGLGFRCVRNAHERSTQ